MRDPHRITRILALLENCWRQFPDLRLGQLLLNVAPEPSDAYNLFHLEDDIWEERLQDYPEGSES